jgi:hypothetical protein
VRACINNSQSIFRSIPDGHGKIGICGDEWGGGWSLGTTALPGGNEVGKEEGKKGFWSELTIRLVVGVKLFWVNDEFAFWVKLLEMGEIN